MATIDLNADLGEGMASDAALLRIVTSASVACGGHAGDPATMRETLLAAKENAVTVGAHPGWPDRTHFGRQRVQMPLPEVRAMLLTQIAALRDAADEVAWPVRYVKLHGALANQAAEDVALAGVVAEVVLEAGLAWLVMARTAMQRAALAHGVAHLAEAYADRTYTRDGLLTPRGAPDAVLHAPDRVADRALQMLQRQALPLADGTWLPARIDSLCVHGDTPGAAGLARTLRARLHQAGWALRAPDW